MKKIWIALFSSSILITGCSTFKDVPPPPPPPEPEMSMEEVPDNEQVYPERERYNPSEKRINDVIHTRLEVSFDFDNQYLLGNARIKIKPYFYPTDSLKLDAKGFEINSVKMINAEGMADLEYDYDSKFIRIQLDKTYFNDDEYEIEIDYIAKPNELEAGGSAAITGDKGLYFINPKGEEFDKPTQIWTQGETESNSCWFPTIDKPNERMTQELFIRVPDKYKTLSNGQLVYSNYNDDDTHTDYWKMDLPHAPYLTMMAIGEYRVGMDKWESKEGKEIPVNYYIEDEYSDYVFNIFGNTPEMIQFYSDILDYEYPWQKYSQVIVRDYVSGAMENTTATVHGEFLNVTDRELLDGNNEDIIAHELFHQWFGDLVTCESWANLPLNESFATYGEYLWLEYKYGKDEADYHSHMSMNGYLQEAKYDKKKTIRYGYTDKELMFDGHSYNKGGRILHMLRNYVGDEAFFVSLNKYLVDNAYSTVEIHNLRLAFEEVTGEDLNWFFDQWFFGIGHPVLEINYDWVDEGRKQIVKIKQVQDLSSEPIFRLPFAIDIYEGGKRTRHEVVMDQVYQEFVFEVESKPLWVNVDGDKMLLCEKMDNKSEEWFVQQFYKGTEYMDRYESIARALEIGGEQYDHMIVDALMDRFDEIKLMGLSGLSLVKDNLIGAENMVEKLCFDKEAPVRAAAITAMGEYFEISDAMDYYIGALKDPSYGVMSAGLMQMANLNPEMGLERCKDLEKEDSFELSNTISVIYSLYGSEEQHDYFKKKAATVTGYSQYVFLQNYASYLSKLDDKNVDEGLDILYKAAVTAEPWWVRISGHRSLNQVLVYYEFELTELEKENSSEGADKVAIEARIAELEIQIAEVKNLIDEAVSKEANERVLQSLGK